MTNVLQKINQTQTSPGGCLGLSGVLRKLCIDELRSGLISTACVA